MIAGFVGKIYLDGRQAGEEERKSLKECLTVPNGYRVETMAFGSLAVASAAQIRNGFEYRDYAILNNENCVIVGSGSIYNKEEVMSSLKIKESCTELELIYHGWMKIGNDIVKYINGDWMFAAYDKRKAEVIISRSWGLSSMYFYQGNDFLAFATHPNLLLAIPEVPCKPDIRIITQILCALPIVPEATVWEGIQQLPPASSMLISHGTIRKETWWRPTQVTKIKVQDEREVLDKFMLLYRKAVRNRLKDAEGIGATLSSGLDSSSICMLAADELLSKDKRLQAWTSVPYYKEQASSFHTWLADEGELASDFIKSTNNINHVLIDSRDADPINAIRFQLLRTGRPQSSVANLYWIDSILQSAAASRCDVVLIGQFGNSTVSYSPFHVSLFPKSNYFPETTWLRYFKIIKQRLMKDIINIKKSILDTEGDGNYLALNPEYLKHKDYMQGYDKFNKTKKITHKDINEIHMGSFDLWYHNSFWSGVEVRDPSMDIELTEFLLSLPDNMFFRDCIDRRMIRIGMEGYLPDTVRLNKRRGQQASDIVPRIRHFNRQAGDALSVIENSELAKELLDIDRMKKVMDHIMQGEDGFNTFCECSRILLPGLSTGLFLSTFDTDFDLSTNLG